MDSREIGRADAHRAKMSAKRMRPLVPGFTAVPNRRVNNAIEAATALIMLANAEAVAAGTAQPFSPFTARAEAARRVARDLPPPRRVFDWRQGLPTKNDNPEYRK